MKTILIFSIIAGATFLFSCSQEQKPVAESSPKEVKVATETSLPKNEMEKNAAGEKIFTDNCINCHGADGKLKHNEAKDLSVSSLTVDERIKVISSAQTIGSRLHASRFPNVLSEDDIKNVAQYTLTLKK